MGGGRQGRGAQYARCGGAESGLMRGSRQGRRGGGHGDSATARAQILDISWKSTGTCSEFGLCSFGWEDIAENSWLIYYKRKILLIS